jgi:hypothetical protein
MTHRRSTVTEQYLKRWVRSAALKTPLDEIKRHIVAHAGDLFDETRNNPVSWSASMHNLMAMFDTKTGARVRAGHQVYKFAKKYANNKSRKIKWLVGPPGSTVPPSVDVTYVPAGKKMRKGDRLITAREARNSHTR